MFKRKLFLLALLFWFTLITAKAGNLVSLQGEDLDYQAISAEGQVVLFVWTTWCPYCQIQLDNLAKQCSYSDVDFVLVNSGERQKTVTNFVQRENLPGCIADDIVLDKNSTIAKKFSVSGFPTFIFLKDGKYLARSYYFNQDLIEKIY